MATYACGVPLGVGVDLPRTPAVFPEKRMWSLPEQQLWGGASERALHSKGKTRRHYAGAEESAKEVEKELWNQGAVGQILILPLAKARAIFGVRLTIASLNAFEKSVDEDGLVTVRIISLSHHRCSQMRTALQGGT